LDIYFPEGLIGCEEWRHFALEAEAATAPVLVLRSLDEPAVSFLVTDPFLICPDYHFELTEADADAVGATGPADVGLLCILNVHLGATGAALTVTANLLGPLVIHRLTGRARQVVLANSAYSAHHVVAEQSGNGGEPC